MGAVIISVIAILILIFWPKVKQLAIVPSALLVVALGVILGKVFEGTSLAISAEHFVQIPMVNSSAEFFGLFVAPDFSQLLTNKVVWTVAITIAIVASLETLLSVEAVDKIDPIKRVSPTNRELIAQGVGNTIAGMLGGLPMTAVIVRSSANVNAGGRTKVSSIFHGFWLLLSFLFIPGIINMIPLSALAAILLMTGYKLAKPALIKKMWNLGYDQFIPFVVTLLAVVFTDLLKGVGIGMVVGLFFILRTNMRNPYFFKLEKDVGTNKTFRLELSQEVSFLNKGAVQYAFTHLPNDSKVIIDATNSRFIDHDVIEIIYNFKNNAYTRNIEVELIEVKEKYDIPKFNI
jgi:MFS superfamily sulfate permease-like transporter